jgi:hypothetical protein
MTPGDSEKAPEGVHIPEGQIDLSREIREAGWIDRPDVPVVAMDASQMEPPVGLVASPSPPSDSVIQDPPSDQ